MDTQTLQRLRAEVEAASTLHLALGRIAVKANPRAPTAWTGPLLEELEDLTEDDGSFAHAGLSEIRRRSGAALVAQYHAVRAAIDGATRSRKGELQRLLDATLVAGTQDASIPTSPSIPGALVNLVRSAGLHLDATMRAAMVARDGLPPPDASVSAPKAPARKKARKMPAAPARKKAAVKAAGKKTAAKKKTPARKKTAPRKTARKSPSGKSR